MKINLPLLCLLSFFLFSQSYGQSISGGKNHSLFICNNGTVMACGRNAIGQLGDGSTTLRSTPVQVSGLSGITAVSGGGDHSLFLKNDGTVWGCGSNGLGELGDGTNICPNIPTQAPGLSG